jgi:transcriptional regulator with XRE-family HTH domain
MAFRFNAGKVKGIMAQNGMTQKDLAAVIDCASNSVFRKLSGVSPFTVSEIATMANYFNVDPSYFFTNYVDVLSTTTINQA